MGYCLGTQVGHQDYNQDHLPTQRGQERAKHVKGQNKDLS